MRSNTALQSSAEPSARKTTKQNTPISSTAPCGKANARSGVAATVRAKSPGGEAAVAAAISRRRP